MNALDLVSLSIQKLYAVKEGHPDSKMSRISGEAGGQDKLSQREKRNCNGSF
jgi:hypothetical protein